LTTHLSRGVVMTNAPEEPSESEFTTDRDDPEAAGPPDPLHEPTDEPRFAPEGDDTPEVPVPDADESHS
jgi:hypothetical protein